MQAAEAVDYVYTDGKVYTVDEANRWMEPFAVRGSDIQPSGVG